MVFRKLYIQVSIRIVIIVITSLALARFFFADQYIHTSLIIAFLLIMETVELIRYINKTNRLLSRFFSSLPEKGSSLHIRREKTDKPYTQLIDQLERVNELIQKERIEKEKESNYLKYIIEQIGAGIITYEEGGKVDLINPATKRLFGVKHIPDISFLNQFNPEFEEILMRLATGKHALISVIISNELYHLTIRKALFKLENRTLNLVTFQDINSELDKKELDSWQKIIRVLTHEIMSTISPVTSLSEHLLKKIREKLEEKGTIIPEKGIGDDIIEGLEIIKSRGKGLTDFVQHYHSLTNFPVPETEEFHLKTFLERVTNLFRPDFENKLIELKLEVEEGMVLCADRNQIQQVLINLIKNAIYALGDVTEKKIDIKGQKEKDNVVLISIKDNGCGIKQEDMENIFIPFYSTRKEGSGIGLSLAKQIMRMHNGQISVKSELNKGTEFVLRFQ